MNVNPLSANTESYLQSLISNAVTSVTGNISSTGTIDPSSLTLPQDSNPQLSPFAQILSTLQQLQQSNPTQYQQVTSQIATNLQAAAQTATASGNTSQAAQLNQLATDFTNASQNNTLPNIQDLAQAAGGHGHHHHHMHPSSSSSDGTSTNSTSSTSTSAASSDPLSQAISAFLTNSTSSTQNSALDPLSIISNTLSNAGLS